LEKNTALKKLPKEWLEYTEAVVIIVVLKSRRSGFESREENHGIAVSVPKCH
jgi:hypothetical protein